jgi:hypothetical protein
VIDFILTVLISCLMGLGIGGETASLPEGGGPRRILCGFELLCRRWKEFFRD